MAARNRQPRLCTAEIGGVCGGDTVKPDRKKRAEKRKVQGILDEQGADISAHELGRFVNLLNDSIRYRELAPQVWAKNWLRDNDIIRLIQLARDSGDLDGAVWRSFLAAHFGRSSAHPAKGNQAESAALLLCEFGADPKWTWKKVRARPKTFHNWLYDHADDLETLSFGNHRKYESQQPDRLWEVIESFIELANGHGGPIALVTIAPEDDSDDPFDLLYQRLSLLYRFGRTGRFDFLVLLTDLGLISAEPKSCYLQGATGPRKGAKRLWGERGIRELDRLAAELAERLNVSPIAMEDALCNWQK